MYYEINGTLNEIAREQINPDVLTVGFITCDELKEIGDRYRLDEDTIVASHNANPLFRTDVDVHDAYTFAELRIVNREGEDDFISLYIMKNLILVVDILDADSSTKNSLLKALRKYPGVKMCAEKLICYFVEALLSDGNKVTEAVQAELTEMEESIVAGSADKETNIRLLNTKKKLLKYYNYYSQILDITETLEDNDNEIFEDDNLIYITNLTNKVSRLRDDINSLSNTADHLQDAYTALLDQRMNNTMKIFTIITTIFFPLTIIVGWYGMNFTHMPELTWEYGYYYVIGLSVIVILLLVIIGKKKKWF